MRKTIPEVLKDLSVSMIPTVAAFKEATKAMKAFGLAYTVRKLNMRIHGIRTNKIPPVLKRKLLKRYS